MIDDAMTGAHNYYGLCMLTLDLANTSCMSSTWEVTHHIAVYGRINHQCQQIK